MDQRALAGAGDAGHDDEHAERDVDVDVLQVVRRRAADLERAGRRPHGRLERGAVVEVPAGERAARAQALDTALEADVPPAVPAPGPRSTTWSAIAIVSGSCSTTRTVLPLSRSRSSRSFIRCDVVWMQADRGLVEDVGHVGERGAELADHLGALRLAAREGARRPVEREVAEADLHERVERLLQRRRAAARPTARRGRGSTRPGR